MLAEFKNAREHIAAMVRTAPNETLGDRYQQGLVEFDQALAAVQEHLEASGLAAPPLPPMVVAQAQPAPTPTSPLPQPEPAETEAFEKPRSRALSYLAWFFVFLVGAGGGVWIYLNNEQARENQRLVRIAFLESQGSIMVENRRWQDAATAFAEIETLSPGSDLALRGRRSIEAGMGEEQTQFVGYWIGQATAELEAGRLDEAVAATQKVLDRFPGDKEATAILGKVAAARAGQSRTTLITAARAALDQRKWSAAISTARQVLASAPADPDGTSILADATAALEKETADQVKADELLKKAIARDQGVFDQQMLDWLREARSLAPDNAEIAARLEKLSSYTRTLRVPGDYATPAEALANARDRDRIVLGTATWKGPLVVNVSVELEGAGFANTKVECAPESGSAITIGPDAKGARISGITFRHESFAVGTARFSVALIRGGSATFVDCRFQEASGHGLAVIEGGQGTVSRSRFADNGWDGVAAIGKGTTLEVRDSESLGNFEHGIEAWDGAAATLIKNRCEGNSRNGIHTDNGIASATIEGNQLIANREFGLVLESAGAGKVTGNTAHGNILGGIVIRAASSRVQVTGNEISQNQGPGLILEKGLLAASYAANPSSQNSGQQIVADADLSPNDDKAPESEKIPRASIIAEPVPFKRR